MLRAANTDTTDGGERRQVITWAPGTVDNEFMGKKKSKCCCIYEKPRNWDDPSSSSSSDEDDDDPNPRRCTENCRGHTKHCYTKKAAAKQKEAQAESSSTVVIEPLENPKPNNSPENPNDKQS